MAEQVGGLIMNIDVGLKDATWFNILNDPIEKLMQDTVEQFEKDNPIGHIFAYRTIDVFQKTYRSNIGFSKAFEETNDFAVGPLFNVAEGFSATYRTRTFQGAFMITQQLIEDRAYDNMADLARAYTTRWEGDKVDYALNALQAGFGEQVVWGKDRPDGKSVLRLTSADTVDGDIYSETHNALFTNKHTIVKRDEMTDADIEENYQSNCFYSEVNIKGSEPDRISRLAEVINSVITKMENYKDDNGKYTGVMGAKEIIAANDEFLKGAINAALSLDMFKQGEALFPNPALQRATAYYTSYLNDIPCTKGGIGFFIVDRAYNDANHGPEFTTRIPFTLKVIEQSRPSGVIYDGRERFDINCASWRGITYVSLVKPDGASGAWNDINHFTEVEHSATIVLPVEVVNMTSDDKD